MATLFFLKQLRQDVVYSWLAPSTACWFHGDMEMIGDP